MTNGKLADEQMKKYCNKYNKVTVQWCLIIAALALSSSSVCAGLPECLHIEVVYEYNLQKLLGNVSHDQYIELKMQVTLYENSLYSYNKHTSK